MALPSIPNVQALSRLMGLPPSMLRRYERSAEHSYKEFHIPKRSRRSQRVICAPSRELKGIQRCIVACILREVALHEACMAFRPGRSVLDNCRPHVGQDVVVNLDLADFFPSISRERVYGMFASLGYGPGVASTLAKLTTYRGSLPQGAPSSPDVANIICRGLDRRLSSFCSRRGWQYTRYCDDITVSGPKGIGRAECTMRTIVEDEGFRINERKVTFSRRSTCQIVTGLVVNEGIRIPRSQRRRWRGTFHRARLDPDAFGAQFERLRGYVAFLRMVSPSDPNLTWYSEVLAQVDRVRQ